MGTGLDAGRDAFWASLKWSDLVSHAPYKKPATTVVSWPVPVNVHAREMTGEVACSPDTCC